MKILCCDDNPEVLFQLEQYLNEFFAAYSLKPDFAFYTSGTELLKKEQYADIAFLDIQIPNENGLDIAKQLQQYNPYIKIFIVTAFDEYLDDAMHLNVFRYLSKPIDKSRLFRNLQDVLCHHNTQSKIVAVETADGVFSHQAQDIIFVQSNGRKSIVHTTKKSYQSTLPFSHWSKMLVLPCFYLTHRSFLVNMHFVCTVEKDQIQLKHQNKQFSAYLTRRRYTDFKQQYLFYLESVK